MGKGYDLNVRNVSLELRRRVHKARADTDQTLREFVLEAVEERLEELAGCGYGQGPRESVRGVGHVEGCKCFRCRGRR